MTQCGGYRYTPVRKTNVIHSIKKKTKYSKRGGVSIKHKKHTVRNRRKQISKL